MEETATFEFSDDYEPIPLSPRNQVALAVAAAITQMGLAHHHLGSEPTRDPEANKFWSIRFGILEFIEGEVRVYSPKYLMVFWKTTIIGIPAKDCRKFGSLEEAIAFLEFAFVDRNWDLAAQVPECRYTRGPRPQPDQLQAQHQPFDVDINFFSGDEGD